MGFFIVVPEDHFSHLTLCQMVWRKKKANRNPRLPRATRRPPMAWQTICAVTPSSSKRVFSFPLAAKHYRHANNRTHKLAMMKSVVTATHKGLIFGKLQTKRKLPCFAIYTLLNRR